MKFCKQCGNRVDENAIFCPNCGARINGDGPSVNYGPYGGGYNTFGGYGRQPVYDTAPSMLIAILSFVFWEVGLIVWFFCRHNRPGKARSAAKGALASACFGMPIIGAVLWVLWKDDVNKNDFAKVCAISAIVGAGIYVLLIGASIILTLTGAIEAGPYFTLPSTNMASILNFLKFR